MRSNHPTSSASTWLLATALTLTVTAASAAPARLLPGPRVSPTAWGLVQEAWQALFGPIEVKAPAAPAENPHRGPLIDPDGSAAAHQARPRAI